MGNTIGSKIKLEGEKEFNQAIRNINTQMKTMSSEMKLVTSAYDKGDKSVEKYTKINDVLTKQIEKQKEKVEVCKKALQSATEKYGEGDAKTQKWKQSLNNAQAQLNRMDRELKTNTEEMNKAKSGTDNLGKEVENLGDNMDNAKKKTSVFGDVLKANLTSEAIISGVKALGGGIRDLAKSSLEVGSDYEAGMRQVAATMGITNQQIEDGSADYERLADKAKECGAATKFTAAQAAEAENYLALAGKTVNESIEMLPQTLNLAAAGDYDLQTATDQVTDAMSSLGLETKDTSTFVDQMAKTSQKSNTSVQQLGDGILKVGATANGLNGGMTEMNTLLGQLANIGLKGAEGGTHLRNIILAMTPTTDKAAAAWEKLGISAYDADGNLRNLSDVFLDLKDALKNKSAEEQQNYLTAMFNKTDLSSVRGLMSQCGEQFEMLSSQIENSSGCAEEMAETLNNSLKGKVTILQSALEGLGITVFEEFEDSFKGSVDDATSAVSQLNLSIKNGRMKEGFDELSAGVADASGTLLSFGKAALPYVIDSLSWLLKNLDTIIAGISAFGAGFLTFKGAEKVIEVTAAFKKFNKEMKNASIIEAVTSLIKKLTVAQETEEVATEGATVAHAGLNTVMSANPIALVVTAVAALTAGLAVYISSQHEAVTETSNLINECESLRSEIKDTTKAIDDTKNSTSDTINKNTELAGTCQVLSDQLFGLAGKENLSNSEKEKMAFLTSELNAKMPELALQFDVQTGKLNKSKKAVDDYIGSMRRMAIQQAYQEQYTSLAENQVKAENEKSEVLKKQGEVQNQITELEKKRAEAQKEANTQSRKVGDSLGTYSKAQQKADDYARQIDKLKDEHKKLGKSMKDAENNILNSSTKMDTLDETFKDATGSAEGAADAMDGVGGSASAMSDELAKATEQYDKDLESAENSLESSIGIFDKFENKTKSSAKTLQKNLESQVKGLRDWNKNLSSIASRTSTDFADYLKELGPSASGEIQVLSKMSDSELKKYVNTWRKRETEIGSSAKTMVASEKTAIDQMQKSMNVGTKKNGAKVSQAYADGINSKKPVVIKAGREMLAQAIMGADSQKQNAKNKGKDLGAQVLVGLGANKEGAKSSGNKLGSNFASGVSEKSGSARAAGNAIGDSTVIGSKAHAKEMKSSGSDSGEKFVSGVKSKSGDAKSAGNNLGSNAAMGSKAHIKEMKTSGNTSGEKFVSGVKSKSGTAKSAGSNIGSSAVTGSKSHINEMKSSGNTSGENFASGIKSKSGSARAAGNAIGNSTVSGVGNKTSEMYQKGSQGSQGFINGIMSNVSAAWSAGASLAEKLYNSVKQKLDIHSPSRKMKELGEYTGSGLALGVKESQESARKAAEGLANAVYDSTKSTLDIHSPSKKAKALGEHYVSGLVEGIKKNKKYAKASAADVSKEVLKEAKRHLSNYKTYHKVSLKDEVNYWDSVRKQCKSGTQARIDADKKYYAAKKKLEKSSKTSKADELSQMEKHLDNIKVYHNVTLKAEAAYWDKRRKQFKSGTQARIDADKLYFDARDAYKQKVKEDAKEETETEKEKNQNIIEAKKDYSEKYKEIEDNLRQSIKELWDDYDAEVASRTKEISNSAGGLFELFDYTGNISKYETKDTLTKKLQSQVDGLKNWNNQLAELRKKGASDDLISYLEDMGAEEGTGYAKLFNSMSATELSSYNNLLQQKQTLAKNEATIELEGLKAQTNTKIKQMTKEANADIKTAFDEFQKVVKKNGGKLSTTMGTFVTTCGKNGELGIKEMTKKIKIASSSKTAKKNINGAVTGLAATVKSGTKKFETAGTALGAAVAKGITKELGKAKISKTVSIGTNNSVSNLDIQNMVNSAVKSGVQSELKKLNLKIMLDDEVVGSLIRGEVKEALR